MVQFPLYEYLKKKFITDRQTEEIKRKILHGRENNQSEKAINPPYF